MTVTAYVVGFVLMAIATMTVLVVGTLGAADLLHRSRTGKPGRRARDAHPDADTERSADLVDTLMPLGSSLVFVSKLDPPPEDDPHSDHDDPPPDRAA
jgi:hypothetical protein